ncbi:ATP-binding protein [Bombilactobacillus thymidiniphilus]|uniref:carbamoyl-phosphate synthase (ammonia) n=1 Tax=Bombilactobacillus thymidiniphilus TaxID=2923363 RepID=A0ABY4PD45_9LACO|nr:hypothetical protein [Bombilactobacillus thymidiniphilus]UQS83579.1 hypothetical protein MOO47_07380 [Bombilactobacillus thymidiniphilus]
MTKTILITGTITGLITNEKLEQEKALSVAVDSFINEGYEVLLLTENRESLFDLHKEHFQVIFAEFSVSTLLALDKTYDIDLIFPAFSSLNTLNVFRNLLRNEEFLASKTHLLNFNMQNLDLSLSKRSLNHYLANFGFRLIEHQNVHNLEEAQLFAKDHNFPIVIRANDVEQRMYWNTIDNLAQLQDFFVAAVEMKEDSFEVERGIKSFKEITLATVRDKFDNKALIYSSEDMDPIGIHSNDSTSISPIFSLSNHLLQRLRDAVLKLTSLLQTVGICTFHLAVDEVTNAFYVLEISPIFQSKILPIIENSGYPLLEVICQVSIGKQLQNITTLSGDQINAALELTPNHLTARVPVWQTHNKKDLNINLGPHQSSTGAIVVNGNNLETVAMKGFKALDLVKDIFLEHPLHALSDEQLEAELFSNKISRILVICESLDRGFDLSAIRSFTHYNLTYLEAIAHLLTLARELAINKGDLQLFTQSKIYGFTNYLIAKLWKITVPQTEQITAQLENNTVQLTTPASFGLTESGQVKSYYTAFLNDQLTTKKYQILVDNYQNADVISNYEMVMLAHNLLHSFRKYGYSVAARGNLLSKIDSKTTIDFYTDSPALHSHLYQKHNITNVSINTAENNKNYPISILNIGSYLRELPANEVYEIVFIQDTDQKIWLSVPIQTTFKALGSKKIEINSLPVLATATLNKVVNNYLKEQLLKLQYGTIVTDGKKVLHLLPGFSTNVGLVSQINTDFITTLCHVMIGVDAQNPRQESNYFGRKVTILHQNNGIYNNRVNYFSLD